jgi:hypothetical protein
MRRHLTFANVMVVILAFVIFGGGAYAATQLPKNSVGSKQLKKNAVKGVKVADGSLSAADIGGAVNSAKHADRAARADLAAQADRAAQADSAAQADRAAQADSATDAGRLDGLDSTGFQPAGTRTEKSVVAEGKFNDFTPDVTRLSALVLSVDVPMVMGEPGKPTLTGGVEGQRLTIVSSGPQQVIFVDAPDLKLDTGTWSGTNGDNVTLVLANGVWRETARTDF